MLPLYIVYEYDDLYLTYSNLSAVIVLDLSKPEELWTTLEVFIKQVGFQLNVYFIKTVFAHLLLNLCATTISFSMTRPLLMPWSQH